MPICKKDLKLFKFDGISIMKLCSSPYLEPTSTKECTPLLKLNSTDGLKSLALLSINRVIYKSMG